MDAANSGLRREPELPDHVAITKETTEARPAEELAVLDDDEEAGSWSRVLRQQMRGIARQVALDRGTSIAPNSFQPRLSPEQKLL